ncbi:hypothetical protein L798_08534 [Zootermopsis nevadensis]|uniref:Uncharacterized protein n=1 Tax=Zootermopsis nevadensis TaxID=136037 RepID=A0A067R307_ZOONE|nr:hypothetical protein L798_08534 [Zootermopsis nevadensis]
MAEVIVAVVHLVQHKVPAPAMHGAGETHRIQKQNFPSHMNIL